MKNFSKPKIFAGIQIFVVILALFSNSFVMAFDNHATNEEKEFCSNIYKFTKVISKIIAQENENEVLFLKNTIWTADKTLFNTDDKLYLKGKETTYLSIDEKGIISNIENANLEDKDIEICVKADKNKTLEEVEDQIDLDMDVDMLLKNMSGVHSKKEFLIGKKEIKKTIKSIFGSIIGVFTPTPKNAILIINKNCNPEFKYYMDDEKLISEEFESVKIKSFRPRKNETPLEDINSNNYYSFNIEDFFKDDDGILKIEGCPYVLRYTYDDIDFED